MSIIINEQTFIFVLFVFQLLNHSDESSTLLGGGGHSTFTGGQFPLCPPPAGYGPDSIRLLINIQARRTDVRALKNNNNNF